MGLDSEINGKWSPLWFESIECPFYLLFIFIHGIYILFNVFIGRNVLISKFGNIYFMKTLIYQRKLEIGNTCDLRIETCACPIKQLSDVIIIAPQRISYLLENTNSNN